MHTPEQWAPEPAEGEVNPATVDPPTGLWPADPLGERSADVHAGAERVLAALHELDERRFVDAEPGAQLGLLG